MTVGQIIELLVSKACLHYGYFSDCTAFATSNAKHAHYGGLLRKRQQNGNGLETMYDGFTGEQIKPRCTRPTYYMRLKQMTQDKITTARAQAQGSHAADRPG